MYILYKHNKREESLIPKHGEQIRICLLPHTYAVFQWLAAHVQLPGVSTLPPPLRGWGEGFRGPNPFRGLEGGWGQPINPSLL